MNKEEFIKSYWNYYLALEDDFSKISRFVTFSRDNYMCHSIEFTKQYLAICSEVDVVCKAYTMLLLPGLNDKDMEKGILDYSYYLLMHKPNLVDAIVTCSDLEIRPFFDWNTNPNDHRNTYDAKNKSPSWWTSYNHVKHNRTESNSQGRKYYKDANLTNTIFSLAALFVLLMNMYKDIKLAEGVDDVTTPDYRSKIFIYKDWETHVSYFSDGNPFTAELFKKSFEKAIEKNESKYDFIEDDSLDGDEGVDDASRPCEP